MVSESVRPCGVAHQLGKTFYMAVQGGGMIADAARAVGKHAERISPSRRRFDLFTLCKVGSVCAVKRYRIRFLRDTRISLIRRLICSVPLFGHLERHQKCDFITPPS